MLDFTAPESGASDTYGDTHHGRARREFIHILSLIELGSALNAVSEASTTSFAAPQSADKVLGFPAVLRPGVEKPIQVPLRV